MIINIKVRPNSGKQENIKIKEEYIAYLKSSPKNNKANIEQIKLIAKYFNTNQANIKIKRGKTSHKKVIEVIK